MIDLVDLTSAKLHLQIADSDTVHDDDIAMKITQASAIVMDYLKLAAPLDAWNNGDSPATYTIPDNIVSATLLVLSELFENRDANSSDPISKTVVSLLRRRRDPALA